jgi:hypothetical protein
LGIGSGEANSSGSGKSSPVRAGVLPLLIRDGTPVGNGPWRHALTRPGAGDPFDTLAATLLAKFALPELRDAASPEDWRSLASQLREDLDGAVARVAELLAKPKMRLALVVNQLEELFIRVSPVADLDSLVELLANPTYQQRRLLVLGFSDNSGSASRNLALSKDRAKAVAEPLQMRGITVSLVSGYGKDVPVASNKEEDGREKNRRVEVWLR